VDLVVGWPGSVADGRIWANSTLHARLETLLSNLASVHLPTKANSASPMQQEPVPAFILADSAYPSTSRLVPTFKTTECDRCPITKKLNKKLASIRYSIENAFGICKGRFRLLTRPLECAKLNIKRATILVVAVLTLHNFLIQQDDETVVESVARADTIVRQEWDEVEAIEENEAFATREILLRHMRWLELDN
jgi:DDE superfamily endonuclease